MCWKVWATGANDSIKIGDIKLWVWQQAGDLGLSLSRDEIDEMKKADLMELIPPCRVCDGVGKIDTWDFNPMSPTQMPALLWDHLGVPKYCYGKAPNADEETMKKVHDWSREDG